MEELIEKLCKGKSQILFLVGVSNDDTSQGVISHIAHILQCCPTVHVVLFRNHEKKREDGDCIVVPSPSLISNRMFSVDSNQSSSSPVLHEWLQMSKVIFLIDMFFSVSATSGELSTTTHTILKYVSTCQSTLQIFCLHSVSVLYQNQNQNGQKKKKNNNLPMLSNTNDINIVNDNTGITNLMNAFQDVSIIHMVGDPEQVLNLMNWSIRTLNYLSHDVMKVGVTDRTSVSAMPPHDMPPPTIEPAGTFTLYSVSEVFYPLFAPGVMMPEDSPTPQTSSGDVAAIADTMLAMSSPDRSQSRSFSRAGLKRHREDESGEFQGSGASVSARPGQGTALKRSHTLSTIRETSPSTSAALMSLVGLGESDNAEEEEGGEKGVLPPQTHGHTLRRSMSEGRAVPTHPPRPPSQSVQHLKQPGDKDKYGRSYLSDDNYSNESGGSFEWASWRSEQDKDSLLSFPASQLSGNGSPSQVAGTGAGAGGSFWHIFSQEDREHHQALGESAQASSSTGATTNLDAAQSLPQQAAKSSAHSRAGGAGLGHLGLLSPGSPSAPLFMLHPDNNNINYSQNGMNNGHLSLPTTSIGLAQQESDDDNVAVPNVNNQSTGKELNRKLSFLTSSQATAIEEATGTARGRDGASSSSFSFMSGL